MTAPTWHAAGALSIAATAITPALPASLATDDILTLCLRTDNQAITVANAAGGTWTEFPDSPQSDATPPNRGTWFWSRYNGTQTAPTTSDSGAINVGMIFAIRGCITTGDPFDVTAGNTQGDADAGSIPGDTTTVAECLIVAIAVSDRDQASTTYASNWANASLASITERFDEISATGTGGGFLVAEGVKTAAGVVDATTFTKASAAANSNLMVAFKPPSGVATVDPYPYIGGGYYPVEG